VKGEETIAKISETIQHSGGDIAGLIKSLRESYDLIDTIPDPETQNQAQDQLAQDLSKQNPNVLREIFDRELPLKIEQSGLKRRLLSTLSQDKIQDIFGEISTWYAEIRKNESSDFGAVEKLGKLQQFIQTILQAPAAKEIPRQFFEELIRKGLLDQLPQWFSVAPAQPATVFEAEHLLEKSAPELLEKEVRDQLPQLVEKLCQIEYNEVIGKLLDKLLENLKNQAPRIRLPAIQTIAQIYEILQAHNKEQLLHYVELPLLESARQESSPEVHYYMMEILRLRARQNLLIGEYDFAIRILDLMRQHSNSEIIADAKMNVNAKKSLDFLLPEIFDVLVADLQSDSEKKRLGSMQVLTKFGEQAIDPLIRIIKESKDVRPLKLSVAVLRSIGDKGKKRFFEELNLGLTADEIRNFVFVLPDIGSPETVEQFSALLNYPDIEVKKEIMRFLSKVNSTQSKILLIEQLKSKDPQVVNSVVLLFGDMKCVEAVPPLIKLLETRSTPPSLQEDICIALGTIADARAVDTLIEKLKRKPGIFSRDKVGLDRVRMRAAWALRKFSSAAVESALESMLKDKSAPVALTAKESLAVIRQTRVGESTW